MTFAPEGETFLRDWHAPVNTSQLNRYSSFGVRSLELGNTRQPDAMVPVSSFN